MIQKPEASKCQQHSKLVLEFVLLAPSYLTTPGILINKEKITHEHNTRGCHINISTTQETTNFLKRGLANSGAVAWNSLTFDIKEAKPLRMFETRLTHSLNLHKYLFFYICFTLSLLYCNICVVCGSLEDKFFLMIGFRVIDKDHSLMSLTHLTDSLTHFTSPHFTHSLTHSLTHSPTHFTSPHLTSPHSTTHSTTHPLTHIVLLLSANQTNVFVYVPVECVMGEVTKYDNHQLGCLDKCPQPCE